MKIQHVYVTCKEITEFWLEQSWGRSVSIVSDYGLDGQVIGVRSPGQARIFPLASVSRPALRSTQPPIQWVTGGPFLRGRARLGCDTDHSPPSSAKVKNEELYSSPLKHLHGMQWDCFTFFLIGKGTHHFGLRKKQETNIKMDLR
jgi:hypothetical protein